MHIAVGQKTDEMHSLIPGVGHQILPGSGGVQRAVFDGFTYQLGTLGINLATAQSIVAYLAVTHILIGGQADGSAVGFQISMGAGGKQTVQRRGIGRYNSIATAAITLAHTVHNNQNDGFHLGNTSKKQLIHKITL